jgi:hypothetical protein
MTEQTNRGGFGHARHEPAEEEQKEEGTGQFSQSAFAHLHFSRSKSLEMLFTFTKRFYAIAQPGRYAAIHRQ